MGLTGKDAKAVILSYNDMIFRICRKYAQTPEEAEDMHHNAILHLMRRLERFENRAHVSTWIYRVTVNMCLDTLRAKKRETAALEAYMAEQHAGKTADVVDLLERADALRRFLRAFKSKTQQILILHYAHGHSYHETAKRVNLSPAAIAKRVERAKRMFIAGRKGRCMAV